VSGRHDRGKGEQAKGEAFLSDFRETLYYECTYDIESILPYALIKYHMLFRLHTSRP